MVNTRRLYVFLYNNLLVKKFKEIVIKMNENDEYIFYYKNRNFLIKTGKRTEDTGDTVYYARTEFKNILALAECKEKALENCVKKIKFKISLFPFFFIQI